MIACIHGSATPCPCYGLAAVAFAFVFPGQGSQYVGMGQALAAVLARRACGLGHGR